LHKREKLGPEFIKTKPYEENHSHGTKSFSDVVIHYGQVLQLYVPEKKRYISPITDPRCPDGFRKLRFPDYVTMAQDGSKVVSLMHRPIFAPRKYSRYSFLLEAESTPGP